MRAFSERLTSKFAETLAPDARDYLERIARGAERMQRLIDDLLTFSRVSQLFINRTTDLDKARLSRYIPVFQGFFDVNEDTWLKGDTYASSLFFSSWGVISLIDALLQR